MKKENDGYRKIHYSPRTTHACACSESHLAITIAAFVAIRIRDYQETQEQTSEKRTAELGSYVRHVWVLDYIYIPMSPRAR